MPAQQDALDAAGIAAHAGEARELAEVGFARLELAGHDVAEPFLECQRRRDVALLHGLGHHRGGSDADRAAAPGEANVLDAVTVDPQLDLDVVAALGIGAASLVGGRLHGAEVARRALVLEHQLLVQVGKGVAFAHARTFSAAATASTRRSASSSVL